MTRDVRPAGAAMKTGELIALIALMTSLTAMAVDAMLPALAEIAHQLGADDPNDRQLVLTALFAGLMVGQLIFGPLSDALGRKPMLYAGIAIFVAGGLISALASSFDAMLVGRVLQGLGAAGPRNIGVAMVRDRFEGRAMARVMSFVSAVFILVPVLAPTIGQGVAHVAGWRAIFYLLVAMAVVMLAWSALRLPESLPRERRRPLSLRPIGRAFAECATHRGTLCYTLASGAVFGAFVAYLATSQQIFGEQYALGDRFPLAFGALAAAIGAASLVNARLVVRLGMRTLSTWALRVTCVASVVALAIAALTEGHPPLPIFFAYLVCVFFSAGLLFGNLNALAMGPMGHIAGVAAAVIGSLSTLTSVVLGTPIGRLYDGTVVPLVAGFGGLFLIALVLVAVAEPRVRATAAGPSA